MPTGLRESESIMKKALMFLTLIVVLLTCLVACNTVSCKHDDSSKIVAVDAVAPTCSETGLTEGMKCTLCGTMVVPQAIVPVIDCIASDWIVDLEATHTEDGSKHIECTMCGRIVKENVILSGQNKMVYTLLPNNTYEVQGIGECSDKDIVIPSEYNGLPVTSIGDLAFYYCSSLTSVVIPDSVTSIGDLAFYYCSSLTSVVIPDSVTSIGDYAFSDCDSLSSIEVGDDNKYYKSIDGSLYSKDGKTLIQYSIGNQDTSFVIPDSVTSIGDYAFSDCDSLSSVVIPDSVTSIGDYAFYRCTGLSSVVIGDSVTSIGYGAFYNCDSLKHVYYTGSKEEWQAITIGSDNSPLTNATIHYNYVPEN